MQFFEQDRYRFAKMFMDQYVFNNNNQNDIKRSVNVDTAEMTNRYIDDSIRKINFKSGLINDVKADDTLSDKALYDLYIKNAIAHALKSKKEEV